MEKQKPHSILNSFGQFVGTCPAEQSDPILSHYLTFFKTRGKESRNDFTCSFSEARVCVFVSSFSMKCVCKWPMNTGWVIPSNTSNTNPLEHRKCEELIPRAAEGGKQLHFLLAGRGVRLYNHCRKLAISYKTKYIYINTSSNPWIPFIAFIDMHSPNTHTKEMEAHVHQKACIGVSTATLPGTAKTGSKQSPHGRMDQRSVRLMYWLPIIWQCGWISKTKLKSQTSVPTVFITLFNEIKSRQN